MAKNIDLPEIDDVGGLGKIKNKAIIGEKVYTEDDIEGFDKLSRKSKEVKENNITSGWVLLNRDEMGDRSLLYPEDWQFYIKPAPVMSVKHWSSVDDTKLEQVNQVMNEIIRTSVKVDTGNGGTWGLINSWDRFWFILKVREVTMIKGETKIEFEDRCEHCDMDILYNLNSKSLHFDMPDQELIDKYWDGDKWVIDPDEFGIGGDEIVLYNPTIGKDAMIIEWATQQARANQQKKIDELFLKFYMWMMPKVPKDVTSIDKHITKTKKEYEKWDVNYHNFLEHVIKNLAVIPGETLKSKCSNCGGESISEVRFPNGIQQLFTGETTVFKFGSR